MNRHYRTMALVAMLCAMLLLLSCTAVGPTAEPDDEVLPPTDETPANSDSLFSIAGVDIANFTLIRADEADTESRRAVSTFKTRLEALYGIEVPLSTDFYTPEDEASPYEIVLGSTARSGSPVLADADDACISVKNGKLYFCAAKSQSLEALMNLFFDAYATDADGNVKRLYLEEGFMKSYQGAITLRGVDGRRAACGEEWSAFTYGVTGHHSGYVAYPEQQLETQIRLAAELGVTIYRFNFNPVTEEQFAYLFRVLDLCDAYGLEMMLVLDDHGGTAEEIAVKHERIATRCRGRIPYYQIFNETDVYAMHTDQGTVYHQPVGTGEVIEQFNPVRVSEIEEKLRASIEVFRAADPDAALVVNFAFKHYAMIKAFHDAGLRWDIIGVDWYSDMESGEPLAEFLPRVQKALPDYEYMICECNIWAHNPYTEEEQAAYLEGFVRSLADSPRIENLTAVIFYELLDEPAFGNGESHFGLVKNDISGTPQEKKQAYYAIQQWLCGGEVGATYELREK